MGRAGSSLVCERTRKNASQSGAVLLRRPRGAHEPASGCERRKKRRDQSDDALRERHPSPPPHPPVMLHSQELLERTLRASNHPLTCLISKHIRTDPNSRAELLREKDSRLGDKENFLVVLLTFGSSSKKKKLTMPTHTRKTLPVENTHRSGVLVIDG